MPFDANLVLRDGTITLDPTGDADAVSLTADAYGGKVLDLGGKVGAQRTGGLERGLVAVLILPTAPTTYADTLTAYIQQSHHLTDGWQTIAAFPVLYALMREVYCTATTAFVSTDIGLVLTATTDSASDGGVIIDFDPALLTIGGAGNILVQMSDANDDYSTAGDTLTATSGTGVGTQGAAAALTSKRSYGIYVVRFVPTRRYIRGQYTVTTGGDFGLVSLFVTDQWYDCPEFP